MSEIKFLKEKCTELEKKMPVEGISELKEISSSMKKIEDHVNTVTSSTFFQEKGTSEEEEKKISESYKKLMMNLKEAENNLSILEKEK